VSDKDVVCEKLKKAPHVDVFKKEDFPTDLHYKNNIRVGDIIVVAELGYMVIKSRPFTVYLSMTHSFFLFQTKVIENMLFSEGLHGYYGNESSMNPLFMAFGPGFAKNATIDKISALDVYPLMCSILEIEPLANNGSIANFTSVLIKAPIIKHLTSNKSVSVNEIRFF
jgi:hypothetical protein